MTDDQWRQRQRTLQLRIREVAYMLWEASGRDHGRALDFWLAAEQEVLSERVADSAKTQVEHGASAEPNAEGEAAKENGGVEDAADG